MREENSIFLSRDEWDGFFRNLNRFNPERERRVDTLFQEYDRNVSVHRSESQTEIELPWLDDDVMLALLGAPEERPEFDLFLFSTDATSSVNVTTNPAPRCSIEGYTTDSYGQPNDVQTILLAA